MAKHKAPKGVAQEFDDVDYWHKLSRTKRVPMPDGTYLTEYEYMKKFMAESYGNKFDRDNPESNILQTDEQKSWAIRNNNNTNRDALLVSKKMKTLNSLFEYQKLRYDKESEAWEKKFKTGTYEDALVAIMKQSCDEAGLDYGRANVRLLLNIYFRLNRFIKMVRKDQKIKESK